MRTLEEICADLVTQRERLKAFGAMNANVPLEQAIQTEVARSKADLAVRLLEAEHREYMRAAIEQQEGLELWLAWITSISTERPPSSPPPSEEHT